MIIHQNNVTSPSLRFFSLLRRSDEENTIPSRKVDFGDFEDSLRLLMRTDKIYYPHQSR